MIIDGGDGMFNPSSTSRVMYQRGFEEGVMSVASKEGLAFDAGRAEGVVELTAKLEVRIGMLRQWLNEDRITDHNKMVTNEDIRHWLNL